MPPLAYVFLSVFIKECKGTALRQAHLKEEGREDLIHHQWEAEEADLILQLEGEATVLKEEAAILPILMEAVAAVATLHPNPVFLLTGRAAGVAECLHFQIQLEGEAVVAE